jgi:hypothetical protein
MTAAALKKPRPADALLSVNTRGRLVMDSTALSKSVFMRQFKAAQRLNDALEIKKAKRK